MASSKEQIQKEVMEELEKVFETTDFGPLKWAFGAAIQQDLEDGTVTINQEEFTMGTAILLRSYMLNINDAGTNSDSPQAETKDVGTTDLDCRTMLDRVKWLSLLSRPDLTYTSALMHQHAKEQIVSVPDWIKISDDLLRTAGATLVYRRDVGSLTRLRHNIEENSTMKYNTLPNHRILAFSSSATGVERPVEKQTAGYVIMLGDTPIDWRTYRSSMTPLSISQREYVAASLATVATLEVRNIANFLEIPDTGPVTIFCDNQTAVKLTANSSSKTMISTATHLAFLREQVRSKLVLLKYIKKGGQVAYIFNQPLGAYHHIFRRILVEDPGQDEESTEDEEMREIDNRSNSLTQGVPIDGTP